MGLVVKVAQQAPCAGHGVVHVRAGQQLPGFAVVNDVLAKGLAHALNHATMHLTQHLLGRNDQAHIVHRPIVGHLGHTRGDVDFHLGNVAAIGKGGARGGLTHRLHLGGWRAQAGDPVGKTQTAFGATRFLPLALAVADVGGGTPPHRSDGRLGLFHQLLAQVFDGTARTVQGARTAGAVAHQALLGLTREVAHSAGRQADFVLHDLGKTGFVALTRCARQSTQRQHALRVKTAAHLVFGGTTGA